VSFSININALLAEAAAAFADVRVGYVTEMQSHLLAMIDKKRVLKTNVFRTLYDFIRSQTALGG
jgi:L-fucose isomerase-like protein